MKNSIEVITRALVTSDNKILLCRMKNAKWYFLPGGHLEFGELSEECLKREFIEEANIKNITVKEFLGHNENLFTMDENDEHHEINMLYKVDIPCDLEDVKSVEDHIEFITEDIKNIDNLKILPLEIKEIIKKHI